MGVQIQTPNITASSDRERLQQIQSYLYKMAQQLQWAFDTIQTGSTSASTMVAVTQQKTTTRTDPATTFAGIKNLIIKSADIVNAYYEQINKKLSSVYVAQSDFGTYTEEADQLIQENAQGIAQLFNNEQSIINRVTAVESGTETAADKLIEIAEELKSIDSELEALSQSIITSAYIKSGLLYYAEDGTPVYGLEIGQTNNVNGADVFDKFARFSSDRLSFFDQNDTEVAYVSDYKLYITNAEISGSLRLGGRFKIYYNNGLAFQWTGGEV